MCFNAVDRHVEAGLGDKVAFHWTGNDPKDNKDITFKQLKVVGAHLRENSTDIFVKLETNWIMLSLSLNEYSDSRCN